MNEVSIADAGFRCGIKDVTGREVNCQARRFAWRPPRMNNDVSRHHRFYLVVGDTGYCRFKPLALLIDPDPRLRVG
ncbi:MAG: hypothetical protein AAFY06_15160 [Pseudomonadota bacterium]